MPGIEMNIACIILFIEGTIESNRRVLKILKALKTEKGPEAGIKDTRTIIKSKTFQPSLKNFNLYTKIFTISSIVTIVFLLMALKGTIMLISVGSESTSPALGIPMWIPYLSVPIGIIYIILELVILTLTKLKQKD